MAMVRVMVVWVVPRHPCRRQATVLSLAHVLSPCALESPAARGDGGDDGGGVSSDDGVVLSVVMKLFDDVDDGGQLR